MEPFAIHCTTCKARLVVKDEAVIGEILGCPKCGSMVHVAFPAGQQPSHESPPRTDLAPAATPAPGDSVADPFGADAQLLDSLSDSVAGAKSRTPAHASAAPPLPIKPSASNSAGATAPSSLEEPSSEASSSGTRPPALPPPATAAAVPPEIAKPSTAFSFLISCYTRARQDSLLWAGGLAGGVVMGLAAWMIVWVTTPDATDNAANPVSANSAVAAPSSTQVANADKSPASTDAASEDAVDPRLATATPGLDDSGVSEASSSNPQTAALAAQPDTNALQPSASGVDSSASAIDPVTLAASSSSENAVTPARDTTLPVTAANAQASDALPADPVLKLEPSEPADSAPLASATDTPPAGAMHEPDEATPPQLAEPGPADSDELTVQEIAKRPPLLRAEIEQRLALGLERVEFRGVPLSQFAAFVSDLGGVPVILDETALAHLGKTRKSPIDVRLKHTTVVDALRAVAESQGLIPVIQDGQILLTRPAP